MTSKLAAQLFTLRDFTKTAADFENALEKIARIGYSALQLSAVECMNGPGVLPSPSQPLTENTCVTAFDSDADNDVDSVDATSFMQDFTGRQ